MNEQNESFIDGKWRPLRGPQRLVEDPYREQTCAVVRDASESDVDDAVAAARAAFAGWSRLPVSKRAEFLSRIARGVSNEAESMAQTITRELGAPITQARTVHVKIPALTLRVAAQQLKEIPFEQRLGSSLLRREPVGAVACITPWNYPLHQLAAKVAGALAAGCTVVLKPSELTPLHALSFARVVQQAELPAGVFNLVLGDREVGQALCRSRGIDHVSFTGSTQAGIAVLSSGAARIRRSALELGGKSACVVLDDADLEQAVSSALASCVSNSGQICAGQSRLLVPRAMLRRCEELASSAARQYRIGDPSDTATDLGPLVSAEQLARVRRYVEDAEQSGTRLVLHGRRDFSLPTTGYFWGPTIFSDVNPTSRLAQEEVFGPVLSLIAYDDIEGAIAIANGTRYGLSGAVWGADEARALEVARQLEVGQVVLNGGGYNPLAPFGGRKASGIGREYGRFGIEEFLECKAIDLPFGLSLA